MLGGRVDETFTRTDGAAARHFLTDGLGSTLGLTDDTGSLVTQYSYEPFGAGSASGASSNNTAQYTGRENDGTGLYFYRARYYSTALQRFISEDPIGYAGGINLYAYVDNNPIGFTDPSGLDKEGAGMSIPPVIGLVAPSGARALLAFGARGAAAVAGGAVAAGALPLTVIAVGGGMYVYAQTHPNPGNPMRYNPDRVAAVNGWVSCTAWKPTATNFPRRKRPFSRSECYAEYERCNAWADEPGIPEEESLIRSSQCYDALRDCNDGLLPDWPHMPVH
jgi:RHS repeat-associated protein